MTVVSMDDRGRVTIPPELRESLGTKRFIVHMDEEGLHLVPLPDPRTLRGSLKVSHSDEELEEAAEAVILKRSK
ncbi:MAG: AbrB/MazE/SpoVT family DNA-binding domain-containing protein [Candidatus Bathyarchaeota archaeon]|jgi:bifunctional DNA-binding transcriptional regulator/antitoxin component of YhaV-PrlF toxin-antitoxin module|nr:AbrB/MazE/SpoVT family DNA-binding domain-containing protein [Candidatus Bathyarchaeota archaeon]